MEFYTPFEGQGGYFPSLKKKKKLNKRSGTWPSLEISRPPLFPPRLSPIATASHDQGFVELQRRPSPHPHRPFSPSNKLCLSFSLSLSRFFSSTNHTAICNLRQRWRVNQYAPVGTGQRRPNSGKTVSQPLRCRL